MEKKNQWLGSHSQTTKNEELCILLLSFKKMKKPIPQKVRKIFKLGIEKTCHFQILYFFSLTEDFELSDTIVSGHICICRA